MIRLYLHRLKKSNTRTLGRLTVYDGLDKIAEFTTLELPWRNNETDKSCIPSGFYRVDRGSSKQFKHHLRLANVVGREDILIHIGNFPHNSTGCIILGNSFADIDGCGELEVTSSGVATEKIYRLVRTGELVVL